MTVQVPPQLDWLVKLTAGQAWPKSDEDGLRRLGGTWTEFGHGLSELSSHFGPVAGGVLNSLEGEPADQFHTFATQMNRQLPGIVAAAHQVGELATQGGVEVEYAKYMIVGQVILLAAQIAWCLANAAETFGASEALIPALVAASRLTVQMVVRRLLIAVGIGVVSQVGLDVAVQGLQFLKGDRTTWNVQNTIGALENGAISGVIGGITHMSLNRFNANGFGDTLVGRVINAGFTGISSAVISNEISGGDGDIGLAALSGAFSGLFGGGHGRPGGHTPHLGEINIGKLDDIHLDKEFSAKTDFDPDEVTLVGDLEPKHTGFPELDGIAPHKHVELPHETAAFDEFAAPLFAPAGDQTLLPVRAAEETPAPATRTSAGAEPVPVPSQQIRTSATPPEAAREPLSSNGSGPVRTDSEGPSTPVRGDRQTVESLVPKDHVVSVPTEQHPDAPLAAAHHNENEPVPPAAEHRPAPAPQNRPDQPYDSPDELVRDLRNDSAGHGEPLPRAGLLGPDMFGLYQTPPAAEFMAGHDHRTLDAGHSVSLLKALDLKDGATPDPDSLRPDRLPVDPVGSATGTPDLLHAIWLGGPLRDAGAMAVFRENLAEGARQFGDSGDAVLWTDVPRQTFADAVAHPERTELDDVRDMASWARDNGITLVNVAEVFHRDHPMVLTDFYHGELAKHTGPGFAAASDILRIEILRRFGGLYSDGDNKITQVRASLDRIREAVAEDADDDETFAVQFTPQLDRYSNSAIAMPKGHHFANVYLHWLRSNYGETQDALLRDYGDLPLPMFDQDAARPHRNSVTTRTGPNVLDQVATTMDFRSAFHMPAIRGIEVRSGQSWLNPLPGGESTPQPHDRASTLELTKHVVQALVRDLHNRDGDLRLTAVRNLVEKHAEPELVWRGALRFIATRPELAPMIRTITDRWFEMGADHEVALPDDVKAMFRRSAPDREWLGEYKRPVTVEAPAVHEPAAAPGTGAGVRTEPPLRDPAFVLPAELERLRHNAPVAQVRTERFDPSTRGATGPGGVIGTGLLDGWKIPVAYESQRIQLSEHNWLLVFTVRLSMTAGAGVHEDQVRAMQDRLTAAIDDNINGRYWLPSGEKFHVRVEFGGKGPSHGSVTVHSGLNTDVENWSVGASDAVMIHELMHKLGVGERYRSDDALLRGDVDDSAEHGAMSREVLDGSTALVDDDLRQVYDVHAASAVQHDHRLGSPGLPERSVPVRTDETGEPRHRPAEAPPPRLKRLWRGIVGPRRPEPAPAPPPDPAHQFYSDLPTLFGDGQLDRTQPLDALRLPSYLRDSKSLGLGRARVFDEILTGVRESVTDQLRSRLRDVDTVHGLDAIENAMRQDFDTLLNGGDRFEIRVRDQVFEATLRAEFDFTDANITPTKDTGLEREGGTTRSAVISTTKTRTHDLSASATVGGAAGPSVTFSGRMASAKPVSTLKSTSDAGEFAKLNHAGSEIISARSRIHVTLTDSAFEAVDPTPRDPVEGPIELVLPSHALGDPLDTVDLPLEPDSLGMFGTEAVVVDRRAFATAVRQLPQSVTEIGAPGRVALWNFLGKRNVRDNLTAMSHGWIYSPDLVSADGSRIGAVRMRAVPRSGRLTGSAEDYKVSGDHRGSDLPERAVTSASGGEAGATVGATGVADPTNHISVGGGLSLSYGYRRSVGTLVSDKTKWATGVTAEGPTASYETKFTLQVQVLGNDIEDLDLTGHLRLTGLQAGRAGLEVPAGMHSGFEPTDTRHYPPAYLESGQAIGPSKVIKFEGAAWVRAYLERTIQNTPSLRELLPDFGDFDLPNRSRSAIAAILENRRTVDYHLSTENLASRLNSQLGRGVRFRLKLPATSSNRYLAVLVKARMGPLDPLGKAPKHKVEVSGESKAKLSVTGSSQHTLSIGVEGRVTTPITHASTSTAPTTTAGARYAHQRVRSVDSGPEVGSKLVEGGGEASHGYQAPLLIDVTIEEHRRDRAWVRRIVPGGPGLDTPPVRTLATTLPPPPKPTDGAKTDGAKTKPAPKPRPIKGSVTLLVPEHLLTTAAPAKVEHKVTTVPVTNPRSIAQLRAAAAAKVRPDNERIEALVGAEHIHAAAVEALTEAAGTDTVLSLSGSVTGDQLDHAFSPETLTSDPQLLSHGTQVDGLQYNRRVTGRVGAVGVTIELSNPKRVAVSDIVTMSHASTGGYAAAVGRKIQHSAGLALGETFAVKPATDAHGSGTFAASSTLRGFTWTTKSSGSLGGTLESSLALGKGERTVLLQMDATVHVVAESRLTNVVHDTPVSTVGRDVLMPRCAFVRVTEAEAQRLGMLPQHTVPATAPPAQLTVPTTLLLDLPSVGFGHVEPTDNLTTIVETLKVNLGELGEKLLPSSVLDDSMGNVGRITTQTSQEGVRSLVDSALNGGVPLLVPVAGRFTHDYYEVTLHAVPTGKATPLGIAYDSSTITNVVVGSVSESSSKGKESSSALGGRFTGAGLPGTAGPSVLASVTNAVAANVSRATAHTFTTAAKAEVSQFAVSTGPQARHQLPVRFELIVKQDGARVGFADTDQVHNLVVRKAADDQSPVTLKEGPSGVTRLEPEETTPEALREWQEGGVSLPPGAHVDDFTGSMAQLREAALQVHVGDLKRVNQHAMTTTLTPEVVRASLPLMLRGRSVLVPGLDGVEMRARLTGPQLASVSDSVVLGGGRTDSVETQTELSRGVQGSIEAVPAGAGGGVKDPDGGSQHRDVAGTFSGLDAKRGGFDSTTVQSTALKAAPSGFESTKGRTKVTVYHTEVRFTRGAAGVSVRSSAAARIRTYAGNTLPGQVERTQDAVKAAADTWKTAEQALLTARHAVNDAEEAVTAQPDNQTRAALAQARLDEEQAQQEAQDAQDAWWKARARLDDALVRANQTRPGPRFAHSGPDTSLAYDSAVHSPSKSVLDDESWRHSNERSAPWFEPEASPLRPEQWEHLRRDDLSRRVHTEIADVKASSGFRGGRLVLEEYTGLVRYDLRHIEVVPGRWVLEFTIKVFVTGVDVAGFRENALRGVDEYLNRGYRGPSRAQFHMRLEFVDSEADAHVSVATGDFATDQTHAAVGESPEALAHEFLHLVGPGDEYKHGLVLEVVDGDGGLMTGAVRGGGVVSLKPRNLWLAERIARDQVAVPDTRLGVDYDGLNLGRQNPRVETVAPKSTRPVQTDPADRQTPAPLRQLDRARPDAPIVTKNMPGGPAALAFRVRRIQYGGRFVQEASVRVFLRSGRLPVDPVLARSFQEAMQRVEDRFNQGFLLPGGDEFRLVLHRAYREQDADLTVRTRDSDRFYTTGGRTRVFADRIGTRFGVAEHAELTKGDMARFEAAVGGFPAATPGGASTRTWHSGVDSHGRQRVFPTEIVTMEPLRDSDGKALGAIFTGDPTLVADTQAWAQRPRSESTTQFGADVTKDEVSRAGVGNVRRSRLDVPTLWTRTNVAVLSSHATARAAAIHVRGVGDVNVDGRTLGEIALRTQPFLDALGPGRPRDTILLACSAGAIAGPGGLAHDLFRVLEAEDRSEQLFAATKQVFVYPDGGQSGTAVSDGGHWMAPAMSRPALRAAMREVARALATNHKYADPFEPSPAGRVLLSDRKATLGLLQDVVRQLDNNRRLPDDRLAQRAIDLAAARHEYPDFVRAVLDMHYESRLAEARELPPHTTVAFGEREHRVAGGALLTIADRLARQTVWLAGRELPLPIVRMTGYGNGGRRSDAQQTGLDRARSVHDTLRELVGVRLMDLRGDSRSVTVDSIRFEAPHSGGTDVPLRPNENAQGARRKVVIEFEVPSPPLEVEPESPTAHTESAPDHEDPVSLPAATFSEQTRPAPRADGSDGEDSDDSDESVADSDTPEWGIITVSVGELDQLRPDAPINHVSVRVGDRTVSYRVRLMETAAGAWVQEASVRVFLRGSTPLSYRELNQLWNVAERGVDERFNRDYLLPAGEDQFRLNIERVHEESEADVVLDVHGADLQAGGAEALADRMGSLLGVDHDGDLTQTDLARLEMAHGNPVALGDNDVTDRTWWTGRDHLDRLRRFEAEAVLTDPLLDNGGNVVGAVFSREPETTEVVRLFTSAPVREQTWQFDKGTTALQIDEVLLGRAEADRIEVTTPWIDEGAAIVAAHANPGMATVRVSEIGVVKVSGETLGEIALRVQPITEAIGAGRRTVTLVACSAGLVTGPGGVGYDFHQVFRRSGTVDRVFAASTAVIVKRTGHAGWLSIEGGGHWNAFTDRPLLPADKWAIAQELARALDENHEYADPAVPSPAGWVRLSDRKATVELVRGLRDQLEDIRALPDELQARALINAAGHEFPDIVQAALDVHYGPRLAAARELPPHTTVAFDEGQRGIGDAGRSELRTVADRLARQAIWLSDQGLSMPKVQVTGHGVRGTGMERATTVHDALREEVRVRLEQLQDNPPRVTVDAIGFGAPSSGGRDIPLGPNENAQPAPGRVVIEFKLPASPSAVEPDGLAVKLAEHGVPERVTEMVAESAREAIADVVTFQDQEAGDKLAVAMDAALEFMRANGMLAAVMSSGDEVNTAMTMSFVLDAVAREWADKGAEAGRALAFDLRDLTNDAGRA